MDKKKIPPLPSSLNPLAESLDPVIFREGSQVQEQMNLGNYLKALQMVRKSISTHQHSPHLLYLESVALQFLAKTAAKDSKEMVKYLDKAYQSVQFAVISFPQSIHFSSCKVTILYQMALLNDKDWGQAIRECKNALMIENLRDPGVDKFLPENEMLNSSKEWRIESEKQIIRQYLELCEDEQKQVQKASRTLVEMKKEFEAEMDRWRSFKQVKTHYGPEKYYEFRVDKKEKLKCFWGTLSDKKKSALCKVSIKQLETHRKSINFHLAGKEAIDFAKQHKTWKFWECCGCGKKFGVLEAYRKHFIEHRQDLDWVESELQIPKKAIDFITNGEWKALDAKYWVSKIVSRMNSEAFSASDGNLFDKQKFNESADDLSVDKSDESVQQDLIANNKSAEDLIVNKSDESVPDLIANNESAEDVIVNKSDESIQDLIANISDENESSNRARILNRIRGLFRLYNGLSKTYLQWTIRFTVEQFEELIPFSHCLGLEAIQIICLLGAAELEQISEFLLNLKATCGKLTNPKSVSHMYDTLSCVHVFDVKEEDKIGEALTRHLLNKEFLMGQEINITIDFEPVKDKDLPDSYGLVSWLCKGATIQIVSKAWTSLIDSQRQKSKKMFQIFCDEDVPGADLNDSRLSIEAIFTLEAVERVERTLHEEIEEGDRSTQESCFRLLKRMQKELEGDGDIASMMEKSLISNLVKDILSRAKELAGSSNGSTDSKSLSEEEESKMVEGLESGEKLVTSTLRRKRLETLEKLAFLTAKSWQHNCVMMQHILKLEKMSLYDCSSMIATLLKSFLQANLEGLKYDCTAAAALASDIEQDKRKKKNSAKDKKSKGTDCIKPFQLHQSDGKQEDNPDSETGFSASAEDLTASILNDTKLLEKRLEDQWIIENECVEKRRSQDNAENVEGLNLDSSDEVMKTAEELEAERNVKNEGEQEELSEKKMEDLD